MSWPEWRLEFFAAQEAQYWASQYLAPNLLAEVIGYHLLKPEPQYRSF